MISISDLLHPAQVLSVQLSAPDETNRLSFSISDKGRAVADYLFEDDLFFDYFVERMVNFLDVSYELLNQEKDIQQRATHFDLRNLKIIFSCQDHPKQGRISALEILLRGEDEEKNVYSGAEFYYVFRLKPSDFLLFHRNLKAGLLELTQKAK